MRRQSLNKLQDDIDKGRDDPVYFSTHLLGITPHKKQAEWLRESNEKINILVPGNRFGKTLITAVKHIWKLFYKQGIPSGNIDKWTRAQYRTVNLSPHSQQMKQCFDYILQILEGNVRVGDKYNDCKIGYFIKSFSKQPHLAITFINGSVFTARPTAADKGDSIQGSSYNYGSYDECCISNHLREEVSVKILPRLLDTGGNLDLVSTPDRTSPSLLDFEDFYRNGKEGKPGFYSLAGSQLDNPHLKKSEIERTAVVQDGEGDVEQTRDGKFVFPGSSYYPKDAIDNMFSRKKFKKEGRKSNHLYTLGWDVALGEDYSVIVVLDITNEEEYRVVDFHWFKGNAVPTQSQIALVKQVTAEYEAIPIVDSSGLGGKMAADLLEGIDPIEFDFKPKSKKELIGDLRSVLIYGRKQLDGKDTCRWGRLRSDVIIPLRDELFKYRLEDERIRQDCVMALALAVHAALQYAPAEEPLSNIITL